MKNEYKVVGDRTVIYMHSPKYGPVETVISTSDLERASEFPNRWNVIWCKGTNSFYVSGKYTVSHKIRKYVYLHRWILDVTDSKTLADHANHDSLDNTRENLNLVSYTENNQNRRKQRNNTSGYPGVAWDKRQNKWIVSINIAGVQTFVGCYKDIEEARKARQLAEIKHQPYKQIVSRSLEN